VLADGTATDAVRRLAPWVGMESPHTSSEGARRSHAERLASRDGYFAPESVIRRVGNSPLVPLLGGGSAVLMQVAHPLVAAGVVEHSDYRSDLWHRLLATLRAVYLIVYGTKEEADRQGFRVQAVHEHVRGVTSEPIGPFPAGTPYSASDPELQLWVHATLVVNSLEVYERYVGRLELSERESYYQEMATVARVFGVPADVIPRRLSDFSEYMCAQLDGSTICVTEPARMVAHVILEAPLPAPLRVLATAHRLSTAALLPPRLRREYGLGWSRSRRVALGLSARTIRMTATPVFAAAARVAPPRYALSG